MSLLDGPALPASPVVANCGTGVDLPYVYLGADDRAGPDYTGRPAVRSHYL